MTRTADASDEGPTRYHCTFFLLLQLYDKHRASIGNSGSGERSFPALFQLKWAKNRLTAEQPSRKDLKCHWLQGPKAASALKGSRQNSTVPHSERSQRSRPKVRRQTIASRSGKLWQLTAPSVRSRSQFCKLFSDILSSRFNASSLPPLPDCSLKHAGDLIPEVKFTKCLKFCQLPWNNRQPRLMKEDDGRESNTCFSPESHLFLELEVSFSPEDEKTWYKT